MFNAAIEFFQEGDPLELFRGEGGLVFDVGDCMIICDNLERNGCFKVIFLFF